MTRSAACQGRTETSCHQVHDMEIFNTWHGNINFNSNFDQKFIEDKNSNYRIFFRKYLVIQNIYLSLWY